MKKIKLLTPILGLTALSGSLIPLTSCGSSTPQSTLKIVPEDQLDIVDNRLYGVKDSADLSQYDTISIPDSVGIIEKDAFNKQSSNTANSTVDYSTITTLIFGKNATTINANAFAGLTNLKTLDLSNVTDDTVKFLTLSTNLFGSEADDMSVTVKMPTSMTDSNKTSLISKLLDAGVPEIWFVAATDGHVSINDADKQVSTSGIKPVTITLDLINELEDNESIDVHINRTGGTDGTLVDFLGFTVEDGKIKIKAKFDSKEDHQLAANETAEFSVKVVCKNEKLTPTTQWVQVIEGFKLTYTEQGVVRVQSISMNDESFVIVGSTLTPTVTFAPANPTNKGLIWKSSDESIAKVKDGVITGVKAGQCTITVTSRDDMTKSSSCQLTVVNATESLDSYFNIYYDTDGDEKYYYIESIKDDVTLPETLIFPSVYDDGDNGSHPLYVYQQSLLLDHSELKTVILPNTMSYIPSAFFARCTSLETVYIPDDSKISAIADYAFAECTSLTDFYVPSQVKDISSYAFYLSGIPSVVEDLVQYYKLNGNDHYLANVFAPGATSGEFDIKFNKDTAMISNHFYQACDLIGGGIIANPDIEIKSIDFSECTQLKTIGTAAFGYDSGYYYSDELCTITAKEITFPSSLEYIGDHAFCNPYQNEDDYWWECKIETINLNEGLTYIAPGAFFGQQNIKSVTIPSTVQQLGRLYNYEEDETETSVYGTFEYCSNLAEVKFAADSETQLPQLEAIGICTFTNTALTSTAEKPFVIPSSVKWLDIGSIALQYIPIASRRTCNQQIEYITIPASVEVMIDPFTNYRDNQYDRTNTYWAITDGGEIKFEDEESTWNGMYDDYEEYSNYKLASYTTAQLQRYIAPSWYLYRWYKNVD